MVVFLCRYAIQTPLSAVADDVDSDELADQAASLSGTFEVHAEGSRLLLSDVLASWPFAPARWHFRAELSPPGEPHVFFDLSDGPSMPVPLLADGTVSLRALPLDAVGRAAAAPPRGEVWAWSQDEFSAFAAESAASSRPGAALGDATEALDSPTSDFQEGSTAASTRWAANASDALSKASAAGVSAASTIAAGASTIAAGAAAAASDFMRTIFKR
jgi:hypothetical protein